MIVGLEVKSPDNSKLWWLALNLQMNVEREKLTEEMINTLTNMQVPRRSSDTDVSENEQTEKLGLPDHITKPSSF